MQRKAYVPGVAVLLAALLAGCTGGSGSGGPEEDSKGSDSTATATAAQPGKYRTLPEACGAASDDTLDSLLPGIKQIADEEQREKAYEGEATLTYDTDRRDGCRWKVESTSATDHLLIDFERVVSYDNAVSDDSKAEEIYGRKETAADLPEPADTGSSADSGASDTATPSSSPSASSSSSFSTSPSTSASASETPVDLQPRTLDGLGDEAFLNDKLSSASSTAQQRTVTVVFRTSNVIVTIEYAEQPTASTDAPDSKEMQDSARKLAQKLVETLNA
ncbi:MULTISPECIES: DUF3558 domain-containing protein [unclassified Streptomyces]|uniref:DUF3558 domain-containing protein n=1 Tax=unclassified Streptomyces TaxID=2593676 RepID=UPI002E8038A9|nr:DUF3558 domain-containing protein [Streptomyces sp. NBC_00589]WTI37196.1 DUF3558 domain-containing protein [Streptomyces sp. NBC_00775]WUB29128.1 DUF3558 domain-containing protein [Streptomyces sp. NBC_00589]